MVLYKVSYCMDGGNSIESSQPSNTRGSGSWLHTVDWVKSGNRKIQKECMVLWRYAGILPLQQIFRVCQLRDRNLQGKVPLYNNSTTFYKVHVLETSDVPIFFSLSQMKNLGTTIELDQKGDKIKCPTFGLRSTPVEHSTVGRIVLYFANLAYQPTTKSREVTFAISERRPQLMHQTRMKMKMRMANHLCGQHSKKKLLKKSVTWVLMTKTSHLWFLQDRHQLHQCGKERGPPVWQDPAATLEHEASKDSRERAEETSIFGQRGRKYQQIV